MRDKTYQYMISSNNTAELKAELKDILRRDDEGRAQSIPSYTLLVTMAELTLKALNGNSEDRKELVETSLSDSALKADIEDITRRVKCDRKDITDRVEELTARIVALEQIHPRPYRALTWSYAPGESLAEEHKKAAQKAFRSDLYGDKK